MAVEEETDNPVGALKNLAYRLRKALRDCLLWRGVHSFC